MVINRLMSGDISNVFFHLFNYCICMRKPALLLGIVVFVMSGIFAQTDYTQFMVITLQPKLDKIDAFETGLAAHNKKYHAADPYKVAVFGVQTGPQSGGYDWVMGPITFAQVDARKTSKEHDSDWNNNVLANCASVSEV